MNREMALGAGSAEMPGLWAEQLTVVLDGRRVLDRVDLELEPGVPVAVTGPSGSGKSVLCLVLAGVMAPTDGRVVRSGPAAEAVSGTGLVLQAHGLVEGLSAEENVWLPLQARAVPPDEIARRTEWALSAVGLGALAGRWVDVLSGGERQRVGIARALAGGPAVLVADEPTSELDPGNRERVLDLLVAHAAAGNVVVIASDDEEVAARCRRVVELTGSGVVRTG